MPVHKGLNLTGLWLDVLAEEGQVGGVFAGDVFGVVGEGEVFAFAGVLGAADGAVQGDYVSGGFVEAVKALFGE